MSPSLAPPVLSTAIHGLSLRVVPARPDETGEASTAAAKVWQPSVERAMPMAGFPPIVAISP